ncbi:hypothetical protein DC522_31360 [Microvirga sp. KLBC 81]|uniref:hypothetical protein n=1 Tax=Microvirga sp. KLBC 81 TaxID=1862707 RepID=UPI000D5152E1|nr:hypothetical protein [Microvirga sp. KLBC 81]PVE20610.1 hypothetical protein DC522_31360 [Microvirga sp. KLBC 81]
MTAALEEQDRFLITVAGPLAEIIRNTAPITMKGAAIKAAYPLEYQQREMFWTDRPEDLN